MDQFFEILAVSCGSVAFFGIFLGFFAYLRYLRYREVVALAEKGLVPSRYSGNGKGALRWGIAVTGLGVALCAGLYPIGWIAGTNFPLNFGPWMLAGLIPTFFGLSLIAIYLVTRKESPLMGTSENGENIDEMDEDLMGAEQETG